LLWLLVSCGGEGDKSSAVAVPTTAPVVFVDVPDLIGQTTGFAHGAADMAGLSLLVVESPDLVGDPNVVVEQLPAAGEVVEQWSSLVVRVPSPPVRLPEVVELSPEAKVLLEEDSDVRVGEAATTLAVEALEDDPDVEHNPFAVMVRFDLSLSVDQIEAALVDIGGSVVGESLDGEGLYLIETLADPEQAVEVLEGKEVVVSAGLDTVLHFTATSNDPQLDAQWGLGPTPGVNAFAAWDVTTGGSVVAVIDSGVDFDHPDLAGQIWTNPGEVPNNGLDDDDNGLIDDVHGWDFHNWDPNPADDAGHGTHVAGTIAAVANNSIGGAGVAPNAQIMALKAMGPNGGYISRAIAGLFYAVWHGADISNHSYSTGGDAPDFAEVIQLAGAFGHLVVAAAGNNGLNLDGRSGPGFDVTQTTNGRGTSTFAMDADATTAETMFIPADQGGGSGTASYPASYPFDNVVSVAAVDQSGNLASFSNYGALSVDVAAPGVGILSTTPGSGYGAMSGTSMAAPHVAGVAALLRSAVPGLSPSMIRLALIDSAHPGYGLAGLMVSGGTVDAFEAIRSLDSDPPILVATSPADDATGTAVDSDIVLTFNEPVVTAVGTVDIYRAVDGVLAERVPVNPGGSFQVTGSGTTTITVKPGGELAPDTGYYVTINPGTFNDLVGNPYAGLTDLTTFNFTTADLGEPTLVSSTPADDATGVSAGTNITLVFSEDVDLATGAVTLVGHDGDTIISTQVFDAAGDRGAGDGQIDGHGTNTLSINPAGDLASHTDYYLTIAPTAITDTAGNPYAGISDPASLNFTTTDTVVPQLVSTTPADGATGVGVDTNITLVFSEDISPADGNITIHDNTDGGIAATIPATSGRVTTEGRLVTINPAGNLPSNVDFYVDIAAGAFTDQAGNPYAGITDPTALNFTTTDAEAPVLVTTSPVDGATGVAVDTNITLTFNEPVYAAAGTIAIHRTDTGTTQGVIPVPSPAVYGSGSNTITIDPSEVLDSGTDYFVRIDNGTFEDAAGNPYAGIAHPAALNFTTFSTGPQLVATIPADGATDVAVDTNITLTFAEPVYNAVGMVTIRRTDDGSVIRGIPVNPVETWQTMGSGTTTITLNPGGPIDENTSFYVNIPSGTFTDAAGNPYAGITDPTALNFTSVDPGAPQLVSSTPADDATGIAATTNLVFTFDEPVYTTTGTITIHLSSAPDFNVTETTNTSGTSTFVTPAEGTIIETIFVPSSQVTGSGTATITVNPAVDLVATSAGGTGMLAAGTGYYVNVSPGAFQDSFGNPYAGITDTTSLNFTSADPGEPQLLSSTPADDATGVPTNTNLVFTFDEWVYTGSGDVTIHRSDNGTIVESIPVTSSQVAGSGTATITINPAADLAAATAGGTGLLAAGTDYYINVTPGAFQDSSGNPYTGITDATTLNFKSADPGAPQLVASTPADGATGVAVDTNLVFTFDEPVYPGSGDVTIHRSDNGTVVETIPVTSSQVAGSGTATITINPAVDLAATSAGDTGLLAAGTGYYINVTPGAFQDDLGNAYPGITNTTSLNFTSADPGAPQLLSSTPADDATGIATDTVLVLTFDEPVYVTSGGVTIHRSDDGTIAESIPVTSSQVTGSGTATITINPTVDLESNTGYYINIAGTALEDTAGKTYAGIANTTTLNFETTDDVGPVLVSTSPVDDATDVTFETKNIVLTFDEPVNPKDGSVSIHRSADGSVLETIPVTSSSQLCFSCGFWMPSSRLGVTINLTEDLQPGTGYYLNVTPTAFADDAGNYFAGITDSTTFDFTTATDSAPILVSSTPSDGTGAVPVDTNIVLTFSENIFAGSGKISIHKTSSPAIPHKTTSVINWRITGWGTNQITYDPPGDLEGTTGYYVNVDSGAFEDGRGNPFVLSDATTLNFTTASPGEPVLVSSNPVTGQADVAADTSITLTFDEPVYSQSGNITVHTVADGSIFETISVSSYQVSGAGSTTITIYPAGNLLAGTGYYINVDPGAFADAAGNTYGGITGSEALVFTTAQAGVPTLVSTTPADGATGIKGDTNIVLTFSEPVFAGTGDLTIRNSTWGGVPVRSAPVTGGQFTGWGTTQITYQQEAGPGTVWGADVYVEIPSGAFLDADGNSYAGTFDSSTFNFTTVVYDDTAPVLQPIEFSTAIGTGSTPGVSEVPIGHDIVLRFDETVLVASGNVTIHRSDDNTVFEAIPVTGSQVTGSGTSQITVNPAANLAEGTTYYVSVDSAAFTDESENAFVGDFAMFGWSDQYQQGAYSDYTRFTTIDSADDLVFMSSMPADDATGVAVDTTIVLNFNQNTCASQFGSGDMSYRGNVLVYRFDGVLIHRAEAGNWTNNSLTGLETPQLTVTLPGNLGAGTAYYVNLVPNSFQACGISTSSFAGITGTTALNFTTASDSVEPALVSPSPVNGATGVAVDTNITLTFTEPVDAETGNITIHKTSDGSIVETIPVTSGQVTGSGTTQITINPAGDFTALTGYYINVDATAFDDTDSNSFAGITGSTTLAFTTIDTSAPTLASSTPADNATGVALTRENGAAPEIWLYFSEDICLVAGNSFRLYKASDGSLYKEWPIQSGWSPDISSFTPGCPNDIGGVPGREWILLSLGGWDGPFFEAGDEYYLHIDPGAVTDYAGNPYAGITDSTTLNFAVVEQSDTTPPSIVSATIEANTATICGTPCPWAVRIDWSEPITDGWTDLYPSCTDYCEPQGVPAGYVQAGGSGVTQSVSDGSGGSFTRRWLTSGIDPAQNYYFFYPSQFVRDSAGNYFPGQTILITGTPGSPPTLGSQSPIDNSVGVPVDINIVLTFSENVVAGSGNVTIHQTSNGSVVETIPAASGLVTGSGTTTITINPAADLAPNTGYYVNVDSSAITDTDGAAYAGITDSATFSFTTGDSIPPVLVSTFPANGAIGVPINTGVVFTFDELVGSYWRFHSVSGGGYAEVGVAYYSNLTLHLASDGSVVDNTSVPDGMPQFVPSSPQYGSATDSDWAYRNWRAGNPVTWDLRGQQNTVALLPGTEYYINMTGTTLVDAAGNAFPGISGSTAFTFTTAD